MSCRVPAPGRSKGQRVPVGRSEDRGNLLVVAAHPEGVDRCGTFEQFVAVEQLRLNRAAYLLARDPVSAQDLVQDTLVRLLDQWPKVAGADDPYAYARRVMLNVFLGGRRRLWHRELPYADVPDREGPGGYAVVDERDRLTGCCGGCRPDSAPRSSCATGSRAPRPRRRRRLAARSATSSR